MKLCHACGTEKDRSQFAVCASRQDGLQTQCRECKNLYQRKHWLSNSKKIYARTKAWRVANREKVNQAARERRKGNPAPFRNASKRWYASNKEKSAARQKAYRSANRERLLPLERAKYHKNRDKELAQQTAWRDANRERLRAMWSAWQKRNRHKATASAARRNAAKIRATPSWANQFFIEEAYDLARLRTAATGFKWEVDHIVPLRSSKVCGLHVENNLQVIPSVINRSKGNRRWPDMPRESEHVRLL